MIPSIKPGAEFPDYELPDHTNTKRKLSFLQQNYAMILVLSRGNYCPKDKQQLLQLAEFSKQCTVGYTKIVTITTDELLEVNEFRASVGANWPFLYDPERKLQKELDIQEYTDSKHDPMIPYTFVLEPGLKIFKIYCGYWYWGRPSTTELHQDLRELYSKQRPDWKIDTEEMREKWKDEKNRNKNFYPYGRSWEKEFANIAGAVELYEK
ncbi:MAG: redoxin domain-containing protein [Bacteroidetes bacterium]|nr:redoxin domain-containing protein [Bacteroidota bacterium]